MDGQSAGACGFPFSAFAIACLLDNLLRIPWMEAIGWEMDAGIDWGSKRYFFSLIYFLFSFFFLTYSHTEIFLPPSLLQLEVVAVGGMGIRVDMAKVKRHHPFVRQILTAWAELCVRAEDGGKKRKPFQLRYLKNDHFPQMHIIILLPHHDCQYSGKCSLHFSNIFLFQWREKRHSIWNWICCGTRKLRRISLH